MDVHGTRLGSESDPIAVAHRFVERINAHDVDSMLALMSADHSLIDSLGAATQGEVKLRSAWAGYFRMVPDYSIVVERTLAQGNDVVLLGTARGTYTPDGVLLAANAWETPVALHARVHDGHVRTWRVYADNEPIRERMRGPSA
jgi:ketosteroid isomerase-like protein